MSDPLPNSDKPASDPNIAAGLPPMPEPAPREELPYQPISGWAIAGLGVSVLCALLVVILTIVGFFQGAPVFIPVWLMGAMAVLGLILSFVGLSHVQNSEGTRVGAGLARIGIWVSVLSGLSYFTYYFVTGLALQSQANAFVMTEGEDSGFFEHLKEGKTNHAFLLTLPAHDRSGRPSDDADMVKRHDTPGKDDTPGLLSRFRESQLSRLLFSDAGKTAEITPGAVQEWKYEKRSYQVFRTYHIKTKEIECDVYMAVFSTEGGDAGGGSRKWFVNMEQSGLLPDSRKPTQFGQGISMLRFRAKEWLEKWASDLNNGQAFKAIAEKDRTRWDAVAGAGLENAEFRTLLHGMFASNSKGRIATFQVPARADDLGKWEEKDGRIRFYQTFRVSFPKEPGNPALVSGTGTIVLETPGPVQPESYSMNAPPPDWNIISIVFTQATYGAGKGGPPGFPG